MRTHTPPIGRALLSIALLVAFVAFAMPQMAQAAETADTTILNVVSVNYDDASGTNNFDATASSIVTFKLVASPLVTSGPPTAVPGEEGGSGLTCPDTSDPNQIVSGNTFESLFALTAGANGDDLYGLAKSESVNGSSDGAWDFEIYTYDSGVPGFTSEVTDPANRTLGSAIVTARTGGNILHFPGGALAGFEDDDIAVIDGVAYLVTAVNAGIAPGHDNAGGAAHSDVGGDTAETQGSLTLAALPVTNISINGANVAVGSGTAPAFTDAIFGEVIGEMVLVKFNVTATADTAGTDANVVYTLTTTDFDGTTSAITCDVDFEGVGLSIQKDVKNITDGTAFGATSSGDPTDVLEYRVTITNAGGDATSVVVTDTIPAYTTLLDNVYAGTAFAQISDGANTVNITSSAVDSEVQPIAPVETGFGKNGGLAAGQTMTFYVGDTSTNAGGGTVTSSDTYTIIYRVQID